MLSGHCSFTHASLLQPSVVLTPLTPVSNGSQWMSKYFMWNSVYVLSNSSDHYIIFTAHIIWQTLYYPLCWQHKYLHQSTICTVQYIHKHWGQGIHRHDDDDNMCVIDSYDHHPIPERNVEQSSKGLTFTALGFTTCLITLHAHGISHRNLKARISS